MPSSRRERRLRALLDEHRRAVEEFVGRGAALDATRWLTPRAEGKWTPAQETQHVMLVYDAFTQQLHDPQAGRGPRSAIRRLVARLIGLTSILWFKRIPVAVKAPREARPPWIDTPSEELLGQLRRKTLAFDEQFERVWRDAPGWRMTHPFFGRITLDQGIRFITVHTRHHAAFLPPSSSSLLPPSSND